MRTVTVGGQKLAEISTRAPYKLHMYSRSLAISRGKTTRGLYADAVERFLEERPWEHGFKFRTTHAPAKSSSGSRGNEIVGQKAPTDWLQINVRLPWHLAQALDQVAAHQGESLSAAAYSALFFYCWFIYPPKSEVERRQRAAQTS